MNIPKQNERPKRRPKIEFSAKGCFQKLCQKYPQAFSEHSSELFGKQARQKNDVFCAWVCKMCGSLKNNFSKNPLLKKKPLVFVSGLYPWVNEIPVGGCVASRQCTWVDEIPVGG